MARHLVWLKWRLLVNGLKADRQRAVGFPLVVLLVIGIASWLSGLFTATATSLPDVARSEFTLWAALVAWVVWATLPVLLFPLDETLDPGRFSLAPIPPSRLMAGLTAAAMVTPTLVIPAVLLFDDINLFAHDPATLLASVAAAVLLLLMLLIGSRAFSSLISLVLRGRRGRDLAMLIVAAIGVTGFALQQIFARTVGSLGLDGAVLTHPLSRLAWLLPPVAAQRVAVDAAAGDWQGAATMLAVAVAWLAALIFGWHRLILRLTTTPEAPSLTTPRRNGTNLASSPLWSTPLVIARKELRFYLRDPRERMVWTGAVIFLGVVGASVVVGTATMSLLRSSVWLPLLGPLVVLFIGLPVALNQFGWERNAASFLFALPVRPGQLIVGKNLATATALLTETALLSLLLTWVADAWGVLPFVFPLAFTGAAIQLAVGNLVSVVAPLRLPHVGTDVFAQASEQGCLSIGAQVVSFFLMAALMVLPVSAFALTVSFGQALSPWIAIGFSLVWGAIIYGIGTGLSVAVLKRRLPEIVAMVQTI